MTRIAVGSGQMWLGDCLDLMRLIPDGSVDMVLRDLPYGTTACKWDTVIPFEPLWEQYWRVCKPNAAVVLTASQPFTTALISSQIERFRHGWIWQKNFGSNFANAQYSPMKEHEDICVFGRGRSTYNPIMQARSEGGAKMSKSLKYDARTGGDFIGNALKKDKGFRTEERLPGSVQKFNCERGLHPTQKPKALFEYLIRTYTNPGDLVLDNCSGSGTTAVAAQHSGRRFICIERDFNYYLASLARIQRECMPV